MNRKHNSYIDRMINGIDYTQPEWLVSKQIIDKRRDWVDEMSHKRCIHGRGRFCTQCRYGRNSW